MDIKDTDLVLRKILKYYSYIGFIGTVLGVYSLLSSHVHVSGHAPDFWHCLMDFGEDVLFVSVTLALVSTSGIFIKNHFLFSIIFIVSTICIVMISWHMFQFIVDIFIGNCNGVYSAPVPLNF